MSSKSGRSYKPGGSRPLKSSQAEIWQLCFDDIFEADLGEGKLIEIPDGQATAHDPEITEYEEIPDRKPAKWEDEDFELTNEINGSRSKKQTRQTNKDAYQMSIRAIATEVQAIPTGSSGSSCTYATTPISTEILDNEGKSSGSLSSSKIRIRRESDLELLLPRRSSRMDTLKKKVTDCCTGLNYWNKWPKWRKIVWAVLITLGAILFYVFVMVAIIDGLGS